jgi:PKD repeat protein
LRLSHGEAEWCLRLRPVRGALAVFVVAVAFLGAASSAPAVVVHLDGGKALSYQPLRNPEPPASGMRRFDAFFSNLDYNGGPVMASNTNYAVYWRPSGAPGYPSDYQAGVNLYLEDLAHDSGGHQNVDSVSTQYNDAAGVFANYDSHFGGALIDTQAYPTSGCKRATICLTDTQIRNELNRYVAEQGLPRDLAHEYFLLTPPGVESCFQSSGIQCSAGSEKPFYCAYHGNESVVGGELIYSNDPYVTGIEGCDDGEHPNGTTSDGVIQGGLSHEHNESITDPEPNNAWTDFVTGEESGYEVGDKCNTGEVETEFGSPIGEASNGAVYNQVINGHFYWYQQEWSNQGGECLQRFTFSGPVPVATFTARAVAGNGVELNATGSSASGTARYSWQFNDVPGFPENSTEEKLTPTALHEFPKGGVYRVALTVFAGNGTSVGTARTMKVGGPGPTSRFSVATASPIEGQPVGFDATQSSDPLGIEAYSWNFGDGSVGTGANPSHTYAVGGAYQVTLTVTGKDGLSSPVTHEVSVASVPSAGIAAPGGSPPASPAVPPTAITALVASPNSTFNPLHATFNAKTGVITLTGAVGDPGTFSWLLTFQNGKFGVFAASAVKCKKGFVRLKGKCRPSTIAFARGSKAVPAPGTVTFTAKPSASALKALKNALKQKKGLPVSVRLTFQSSRGGSAVSHTQSLTVRLKTK